MAPPASSAKIIALSPPASITASFTSVHVRRQPFGTTRMKRMASATNAATAPDSVAVNRPAYMPPMATRKMTAT